MVERLVWDQEVAGSNPVTPTTSKLFVKQRFIFYGALLAAFTSLRAQDAPLPVQEQSPAAIMPTARDATSATPAPSLMPAPLLAPPDIAAKALQSAVQKAPDLSQLDEMFKKTPLGKEAEEFRLHVEWRQLENRVVDRPEFVALRTAAEAAQTDLEKRDRSRAYYKAYFDRLHSLASTPQLQAYLNQKRAEHLALLAQPRVRPDGTEPIPPPRQRLHKRKAGLPSTAL